MLWLTALLWRFYASLACYLARSQTSAEYWKHFMARFDGVHMFGYNNSAESEPIWMKSGALWVHRLGLALADFGRDPRSSESWRARRNFLSDKQRTILLIFCRPNFTKFEHNTDRRGDESFWNRILTIFPKRSFFQYPQKMKFFPASCNFRPP